MILDGKTVDIERLALSNGCFELADRFVIESDWHTGSDEQRDIAKKCMQIARHLAELARNVLGGTNPGDIARVNGYIEAGDILLQELMNRRWDVTA